MIRGIDASSIQGALPFAQLTDFRFLIHKCQQGNDHKDPWFERNIAAAKSAGWMVGAYHFPYPLPHLDPRAQAELFFKASELGSNVGELPPAFDFEWPAPGAEWAKWGCTAPQMASWAKACLERMTELFGCKPLVYTYPWFIQALIQGGADLSFLSEYRLWMADYRFSGKVIVEGQTPVLPAPWKNKGWTFWQHDGDKGLVLPNRVDSDFCVFNGSEEDLLALAGVHDSPPEVGPIVRSNDELYDALRDLAQRRDD